MKKTLIALAAATAATAFAADSVTIYGIADLWFGQSKGNNGINQTVVQSGGLYSMRLAFGFLLYIGTRMAADLLLMEYTRFTGASYPGTRRRYEFVDGEVSARRAGECSSRPPM